MCTNFPKAREVRLIQNPQLTFGSPPATAIPAEVNKLNSPEETADEVDEGREVDEGKGEMLPQSSSSSSWKEAGREEAMITEKQKTTEEQP